ncbi:MAG: hypothetical protein RL701_1410 [Pseudomonadota bacterium]|jgi:hypothetical protein
MSESTERRIACYVDAGARFSFEAGTFAPLHTSVKLEPQQKGGVLGRLLSGSLFTPQQALDVWLFGALRSTLERQSFTHCAELGELRAPANSDPPPVPARPQLILVRSADGEWAGLQYGADAFRFKLGALDALGLCIEPARYILQLTSSADRSVMVSETRSTTLLEIPVDASDEVALELLESVLQLAAFFDARFEYVGP